MLILKSVLHREPFNLYALHMGALNLYNIGDYSKSQEYLDVIINTKQDYNVNVHILKAKAYLKMQKVQLCLNQVFINPILV